MKTEIEKIQILTEAIIDGEIGNLEFIVNQYISEFQDDYVEKTYKELMKKRNQKGITKLKQQIGTKVKILKGDDNGRIGVVYQITDNMPRVNLSSDSRIETGPLMKWEDLQEVE